MKLTVRIRRKLNGKFLSVDFEVEEEIFALLGASGSGKSMTLKCIAGIEKPDKGYIALGDRVFFDSEKHIDLPPGQRRVGFLFQDYALFPHMTVLENVRIAMKTPNTEEALALLREYRVEDLRDQKTGCISGGQKQRVAMARMVASKPEMILLDEPFSALDTFLRRKLEREMTERLLGMHVPVVLVTHDRDEVYRMCRRMACLSEGRLSDLGFVREVFRRPKTLTAARLSGCKNLSAICFEPDGSAIVPGWGLPIPREHFLRDDPERCGEGVVAAGIRAHSFRLLQEQESAEYTFTIQRAEVFRELFEVTVVFAAGGEEELEWKCPLEGFTYRGSDLIGRRLGLQAEDLFFLEE